MNYSSGFSIINFTEVQHFNAISAISNFGNLFPLEAKINSVHIVAVNQEIEGCGEF
jgi:hypothetical protein